MATNRDLLKEAIADAKAVKEMAIANAKAALEESFTPFLREKLSAKITAMDEDTELEEAGFSTDFDDLDGTSNHGNIGIYEDADMDLNELFTELNEAEDDSENDEPADAEEMGDDEGMSDEPIDPDDLTDEYIMDIVQQVLDKMAADGELQVVKDETEETEETPEIESETEEEINIDELLAEIAAMNDDPLYGDDLDDMNMGDMEPLEEDASFFLDVDGVASTAQAIAAMAAAAGGVGLAYLASWWKSKAASKKPVSKAEVAAAGKEAEKRETSGGGAEVKEELSEAYNTIKSLRSDLNEVNLLNAKLLYTNKIFKAKNLTEGQKVNVLSTFDKATTVKEVKLVFETLNEGLKVKTASPIRENLGSASKTVGTTKTKKPIVESNDMVSRFQKLAGII